MGTLLLSLLREDCIHMEMCEYLSCRDCNSPKQEKDYSESCRWFVRHVIVAMQISRQLFPTPEFSPSGSVFPFTWGRWNWSPPCGALHKKTATIGNMAAVLSIRSYCRLIFFDGTHGVAVGSVGEAVHLDNVRRGDGQATAAARRVQPGRPIIAVAADVVQRL